MTSSPAALIHDFRPRLVEKRARLEAAAHSVSPVYLGELLAEIDAALQRMDAGSYGICESCHDSIEADRLQQDPLVRFCLDHLSREQRRAHEQDLRLATEIQARLLPAKDITAEGWATHFRYQPASVVGVGGDYCEIAPSADNASLFFALGDVTGKGVAASLLMTHLSAIFRSLLSMDLPLAELMMRANRLFCESTPDTHYATLAAGRTNGRSVELCNAGHCCPLVLRRDGTERIDSTGLPLGLFAGSRYTVMHLAFDPGDHLALYSDGIVEAQDPQGDAFDEERLIGSLRARLGCDASAMADGVFGDVARFRRVDAQEDDMTLLVLCRNR